MQRERGPQVRGGGARRHRRRSFAERLRQRRPATQRAGHRLEQRRMIGIVAATVAQGGGPTGGESGEDRAPTWTLRPMRAPDRVTRRPTPRRAAGPGWRSPFDPVVMRRIGVGLALRPSRQRLDAGRGGQAARRQPGRVRQPADLVDGLDAALRPIVVGPRARRDRPPRRPARARRRAGARRRPSGPSSRAGAARRAGRWRGRSTASRRGPCSWPAACRAPRPSEPRRRRCGRAACARRPARGRGCAPRPSPRVRRTGLESHDVVAGQPQLGRVLDGHDPLAGGMLAPSALSSVVLPAPAPPLTTTLARARTAHCSSATPPGRGRPRRVGRPGPRSGGSSGTARRPPAAARPRAPATRRAGGRRRSGSTGRRGGRAGPAPAR